MKLTSIVLTAFVAIAGLLCSTPSLVWAEEQVQEEKSLIQIIEDYVVANKEWERGSFNIEPDPHAGEGGFSVFKKNMSLTTIGGGLDSFLIMVDLKTRKIIGTFAYQ